LPKRHAGKDDLPDYAEQLLLTAEFLLNQDLYQAFRARAVSTSYYAVFHTLQWFCTRALLPTEPEQSELFDSLLRTLEHGSIARGRTIFPTDESVDRKLKQILLSAEQLKNERHLAYYGGPARFPYSLEKCKELVQLGRETVERIRALDPEVKRLLAISLLLKPRKT
jgi:uncharacterized protein (UPF0332 family)